MSFRSFALQSEGGLNPNLAGGTLKIWNFWKSSTF